MCFIFICEALVIVYILKHRSFSPVILWSAFEVAIIACLQVLLSVFRESHTSISRKVLARNSRQITQHLKLDAF